MAYPLEEMRLLCLLAVLAGAETQSERDARGGDRGVPTAEREELSRLCPFMHQRDCAASRCA